MSRFDTLLAKALARFGVDPAPGDTTTAREQMACPPPLPASPYTCTPTRWGDDEETLPARPKAARPSAAPAVPRRQRRRPLAVRREPTPRGLLIP